MSGVRAADQPCSMYFRELALDRTARVLRSGGIKISQWEGLVATTSKCGDVWQGASAKTAFVA